MTTEKKKINQPTNKTKHKKPHQKTQKINKEKTTHNLPPQMTPKPKKTTQQTQIAQITLLAEVIQETRLI